MPHRPRHYILNEAHELVPVEDFLAWGVWFETADRTVKVDADEASGVTVSTVFLGLDHNFSPTGPPIVFETMVFCERDPNGRITGHEWAGDLSDRYSTWDDALAGHEHVCSEVALRLEEERLAKEGVFKGRP